MALFIYPLTPVTVSTGDLATEVTAQAIQAATEATQTAAEAIQASAASIAAEDFATETTLSALAAKDFATEVTAAAIETNTAWLPTISEDVTALVAKDFATSAKQDAQTTLLGTIDTDTGAIATSVASMDSKAPALVSGRVPVDGSGVTQPVSAASLPLPTGAATEATLSTLNGKVTACDTGAVVVSSSALPSGASTEAKQDTLIAAGRRSVVDQIDTTPLLDTSSTNIPASASNPVQIIASTAAQAYKLVSVEDIGEYIGVYTGAALSEVLLCILPLGGGEIDVNIPAGTRISLRNMQNAAISSGKIALQLVG